MSSKGEPPTKVKGVQAKRSKVTQLASPEVIAAVKQPLPAGQLEAAPQSFAGYRQNPRSFSVKTLDSSWRERCICYSNLR